MKPFTQAYNFKEYLEASKENFASQGINLAEDVLEAVVKLQYGTTKRWISESAALTSTPIDDILASQLHQFDKAVDGIKIDINKDGV